jgi:hypothetical protein
MAMTVVMSVFMLMSVFMPTLCLTLSVAAITVIVFMAVALPTGTGAAHLDVSHICDTEYD